MIRALAERTATIRIKERLMDRREFLKTCAALGVTVSIPSVVHAKRKALVVPSDAHVGGADGRIYFNSDGQWIDISEDVEFIGYHVDKQRVDEALTVGPLKIKDGQSYAKCSCDAALLWSAVTLGDSEGRTWVTEDGERWECGDMWFEVTEGLGV